MSPTVEERLAAARAHVESACQLLLSPTPDKLDGCAQGLAAAVVEVQACFPDASPAGGDRVSGEAARAEAERLRQSIGRACQLLDHAAAFHSNWIRWLGALCAGYTQRGEPARLEHGPRLVTRG